MKVIVFILLFLLSCSKSPTETASIYKLIYVDNSGKCIPCIQMRKISKDVIDKRFSERSDSLTFLFERVNIKSERYAALRKNVNASAKSLVVMEIKNGVEERHKIINTSLILFSLNKPEYCMDIIQKEIESFMESGTK